MKNRRIVRKYLKFISVLILYAITTIMFVGVTAMVAGITWELMF